MARTIALATILSLVPVASVDAAGDSCTPWHGIKHPPATIRVFRIHHRGSSIPAHVETVGYRDYVERVMAAGAWPAYKPPESLKVGAIAIRQYAAWHIRHHQPGYSWRGRCYDISAGDQYYVGPLRIHSKIRAAVGATWRVWLRKNGRIFRTGWTGDSGRDGWHLHEDTVTRLARRGWSWLRIVHAQLDPVEVIR